MVQPGKAHLEEHYKDLADKPFYPGLVNYMNSGPVVAMCWQGLNVVKQGRVMLGATNPSDSAPGTIRGDYSSKSVETSSTVPTPLTAPTTRLASGSRITSFSTGKTAPTAGPASHERTNKCRNLTTPGFYYAIISLFNGAISDTFFSIHGSLDHTISGPNHETSYL